MRLFIAGILTLVIYLLTPDTTDMPASVYHSQPQPDVPVIYHPLHPSDFFFTTFLQERHHFIIKFPGLPNSPAGNVLP